MNKDDSDVSTDREKKKTSRGQMRCLAGRWNCMATELGRMSELEKQIQRSLAYSKVG